MTQKDLQRIFRAITYHGNANARFIAEKINLSPPEVEAGLEILERAGLVEVANAEELRYTTTD